jgi:tetratricopeptide (TPR) repeat protein
MFLSSTIALALTLAAAQNVADVRQLFDAGRYQEVVRASEIAGDEAEKAARLQFLAAQSYSKLNDVNGARRAYQRLTESGSGPWASIGRSAGQLLDKQFDPALASADQAIAEMPSLPEAHYQRGMALLARNDYGNALDAFTKATTLDQNFAAAYYNAGLAAYRVKRIDLMATNFNTFVRLAPNAPERPEVESILRTVRGR